MHTKECPQCKKIFSCVPKTQKFCSVSCVNESYKVTISKRCVQCDLTFICEPANPKKFCSSSCAGTYNNSRRTHSEETKRKQSEAAKANPSGAILTHAKRKGSPSKQRIAYEQSPKPCVVCQGPIPYAVKHKKTCSRVCFLKIIGGYRQGSGYSKHGWFQHIWCDSLYELAFVMFQLDHGADVRRSDLVVPYLDEHGKARNYHPDFVVDGVLYEIKGWMTDRTMMKIAAAPSSMITIIGDENRPYLDYAQAKHQLPYERLIELYHATSQMYEHTGKLTAKLNKSRKKPRVGDDPTSPA